MSLSEKNAVIGYEFQIVLPSVRMPDDSQRNKLLLETQAQTSELKEECRVVNAIDDTMIRRLLLLWRDSYFNPCMCCVRWVVSLDTWFEFQAYLKSFTPAPKMWRSQDKRSIYVCTYFHKHFGGTHYLLQPLFFEWDALAMPYAESNRLLYIDRWTYGLMGEQAIEHPSTRQHCPCNSKLVYSNSFMDRNNAFETRTHRKVINGNDDACAHLNLSIFPTQMP